MLSSLPIILFDLPFAREARTSNSRVVTSEPPVGSLSSGDSPMHCSGDERLYSKPHDPDSGCCTRPFGSGVGSRSRRLAGAKVPSATSTAGTATVRFRASCPGFSKFCISRCTLQPQLQLANGGGDDGDCEAGLIAICVEL